MKAGGRRAAHRAGQQRTNQIVICHVKSPRRSDVDAASKHHARLAWRVIEKRAG